ncbi:hypothetical protein OW763_13985 [Clostridium aestuarii]|uniref:Uncharacterized protein n=1 Tax=Clostridium aestuarii TaxID=338193 RepID=A0ABT4D5G2_9CLOT|nr:hypothetical protein [Clostridium aestuarii]MCY6485440.1 hypothetical protein [Clostridium aestuarii]
MKKKRRVSKKIFSIIKFAWNFVGLFISLIIKDIYNLNFWIYMCLTVPFLMIGFILINKFIEVNE